MRLPTPKDFHRLVDKVDRANLDGCWLWTGAKTASGYGLFSVDGRQMLAHRVAIQWLGGITLEDHLVVCHRCDVPPCVNPAHLFLGTRLDNSRDMVAKGRHRGGGQGWVCTLTPRDRAVAATMREEGRSMPDIADFFGLTQKDFLRSMREGDVEWESFDDNAMIVAFERDIY